MVCFYTASEEARRAIRGEVQGDSKPSADGEAESATTPREREGWQTLLSRFWQAEKSFCDERFKLIPSVVSCFLLLFYYYYYYYKYLFIDIFFRLKDHGW